MPLIAPARLAIRPPGCLGLPPRLDGTHPPAPPPLPTLPPCRRRVWARLSRSLRSWRACTTRACSAPPSSSAPPPCCASGCASCAPGGRCSASRCCTTARAAAARRAPAPPAPASSARLRRRAAGGMRLVAWGTVQPETLPPNFNRPAAHLRYCLSNPPLVRLGAVPHTFLPLTSPPPPPESAPQSDCGVLLTTYETMRLQRAELVGVGWGYVVLDEGHKIRWVGASVRVCVCVCVRGGVRRPGLLHWWLGGGCAGRGPQDQVGA